MAKVKRGVTRRGFIKTVGAGAGAAALGGGAVRRAGAADGARTYPARRQRVVLDVDGKARAIDIEPRVTLLRALRNHADVTAPKPACDRGACGACSVLVDGVLVASCMMLALDAVGKKVVTAAGLAPEGQLHPIQAAFCQHDALQCGFCTPGMVVACKALLDKHPKPTLDETKQGLAGNICRCGTYTRIFKAVDTAAGKG